ncbi:MAG TPA: multifunctional CCA addition/repair protein [Casimicrobiaceae bacterium]|nr:multifunctional CCA addition/repair protein [Casimicrobiaceae bacterium]
MKIYRVGGSVRDELLGRRIVDRDWVVVGATPEILVASGYKPVGRDFPVFLHPETREEYALARTERKHGRGYRGFEFFVSPDVTLDEDLARRDLTINAIARDEHGSLIDPFGGEADLRTGILRHVSPAFVEDPLRVLRVARFAARFGFKVARQTLALMRELAESGELSSLAPERVWQELARGLMEPHPSRMIEVLRDCGALAHLLPEIDSRIGSRTGRRSKRGPGARLAAALDLAAKRGAALPVRYAILAYDSGANESSATAARGAEAARNARIADAISSRLKAPADCRDAARLSARWLRTVDNAGELRPAQLLALLNAADAFRRPERIESLLEAGACFALSMPRAPAEYAPAAIVRAALAAAKGVDAGAIARRVARRGDGGRAADDDAIARAIRAARLAALRGIQTR